MRTVCLIKKSTDELDGVITVSVDSDVDHILPDETHDVIRLPVTHPAMYEQLEWEAPTRIILNAKWGRELRRRREAK